jgi:hypothetical protein
MQRKKHLRIKWRRLVEKGKTCPRCGSTEQELTKAIKILKKKLSPSGITVILAKEKLNLESFSERPSESNRIWINGRPMEYWLNADVGQSSCCSVCGDAECRTVKIGSKRYERIPSALTVKAGLLAASRMLKGKKHERKN